LQPGPPSPQPAIIHQEVDAVSVGYVPRHAPESPPPFVRVNDRDPARRDRESRVVVPERHRGDVRLGTIQSPRPDDDGAPMLFVVWHEPPVHEVSPPVYEHPLAVRHVLQGLIPRPAHPSLTQQQIPDLVDPEYAVLEAGTSDVGDNSIADGEFVAEPSRPLAGPLHQRAIHPRGEGVLPRGRCHERSPARRDPVRRSPRRMTRRRRGLFADVPIELRHVQPDRVREVVGRLKDNGGGLAVARVEGERHRLLRHLDGGPVGPHGVRPARRGQGPEDDAQARTGAPNVGREFVPPSGHPLRRCPDDLIRRRVPEFDGLSAGEVEMHAIHFKRGANGGRGL
jgi:hypothetical protein